MNVEEVAKGFLFRMRTFMLPLGVVVLAGGARADGLTPMYGKASGTQGSIAQTVTWYSDEAMTYRAGGADGPHGHAPGGLCLEIHGPYREGRRDIRFRRPCDVHGHLDQDWFHGHLPLSRQEGVSPCGGCAGARSFAVAIAC